MSREHSSHSPSEEGGRSGEYHEAETTPMYNYLVIVGNSKPKDYQGSNICQLMTNLTDFFI